MARESSQKNKKEIYSDIEMTGKKNKINQRKASNVSEQSNYDITPIVDRHSCTDIICTVLFFLFIVLLVFVSVFAYMNGNPVNLIKPHDSYGNMCGETDGYKEKPYLLFFDLTKCLSIVKTSFGCPTRQICVKNCPNKNSFSKDDIKEFCDPKNVTSCPDYILESGDLFGRCIPKIISTFTDSIKNEIITDKDNKTIVINLGNGSLPLTLGTLFESTKYLKDILDLKGLAQRVYEDLSKSYLFILIALVIGAFVAFIWMVLFRFLIKPMVFITVIAVLILNAFGVYFCTNEYLNLKKNSNVEFQLSVEKLMDFDYLIKLKETWLAFSIILGVIFLVLFLVILFLRKRIKIACEIIKETSKAIASLPMTLFWPVIPFILQVGIIFYCASIALYLASSGIQLFKIVDMRLNQTNITLYDVNYQIGEYCDPIKFSQDKLNNSNLDYLECNFYTVGFDPDFFNRLIKLDSKLIEQYSRIAVEFINKYQWIPQLFILFMFFWLISFTLALSEMTLAGSFGAWYWTRFKNLDKSLKNKLPLFTVFGSLGRALFYHMGTLAFGSLIIAIIKIIRCLIEFFSNKFKDQTDKSKFAKFIVACCKCCFWCLEKFLKFLNKNSFIITAIYSLNFCSAAAKAFKLIVQNPLIIGVTDRTASFILFLSNLAITTLMGILSFLFFTNTFNIPNVSKYVPNLTYYFVPIILIVIGVYVISRLFFDVFSMGVDTMLMCVLIDKEENDGTKTKPYFMSKKLKKLFKVK